MVDWDGIGGFERYPKLMDGLKDIGDVAYVKFLDEGREVNADIIQKALKDKGQKNIKARDSLVFVVLEENEKKELWVSRSSHTNMNELKAIRAKHGNAFKGALARIERISKDDMAKQSFKFEAA